MCASRITGKAYKTTDCCYIPRVFYLVGLGWSLTFCISIKFPVVIGPAPTENMLWESLPSVLQLWWFQSIFRKSLRHWRNKWMTPKAKPCTQSRDDRKKQKACPLFLKEWSVLRPWRWTLSLGDLICTHSLMVISVLIIGKYIFLLLLTLLKIIFMFPIWMFNVYLPDQRWQIALSPVQTRIDSSHAELRRILKPGLGQGKKKK